MAVGLTDVAPATTATNVNGLEFQLAAVGAGEDVPASAALLSDGTYVVVWQAFEETDDASGFGVYGQRVGADGALIGTRFLINQTTLGYQSNPSVAALANGGFLVAWQGEVRGATSIDPSQYDIFARVYTADGAGGLTAGNEFLVNENSTIGQQGKPAVASNGVGDVVVIWQTDAQLAIPAEELTRSTPGGTRSAAQRPPRSRPSSA